MSLDESHESGVIARSLLWYPGLVLPKPRNQRLRVQREAMLWQTESQGGGWAGLKAYMAQGRGKKSTALNTNRVVEIPGLFGSIGEQLSLAWTAEQDTQRIAQTSRSRSAVHQRLVRRAVAELSAYYLLGASHSCGNLIVRTMLFEPLAADFLFDEYDGAKKFPAGQDDRASWLTFSKTLAKNLKKAANKTSNSHLIKLADAADAWWKSDAFQALDNRRGMDFHRRRPQSVLHASPRGGVLSEGADGTVFLGVGGADLEPEADAVEVSRLAAEGLVGLASFMRAVRESVGPALRRAGVDYYGPLRKPLKP